MNWMKISIFTLVSSGLRLVPQQTQASVDANTEKIYFKTLNLKELVKKLFPFLTKNSNYPI